MLSALCEGQRQTQMRCFPHLLFQSVVSLDSFLKYLVVRAEDKELFNYEIPL